MKDCLNKRESIFGGAKYIKCDPAPVEFSFYDPLPFFRKNFLIEEEIKNARIYLQCPSFAKVFINGEAMTEDIFISPISDYTKLLWYDSYDVTELLRVGINTVGVIVGNGFFNESFKTVWEYHNAYWRDAPQFMLCLKVNGKDILVSDRSFKVSKDVSHIIYSHLRSGEYVDMRKYDRSWLFADYDDSGWKEALERDGTPGGELRENICPPVRETEEILPVSIEKTERGFLADFGVTVSGYARINVLCEEGREITLRFCEEVDENREPQNNRMDRTYFYPESPFQTDKLIASGREDSFKPLFTYHGFRYVLIEGLSDISELISLRAYFTHNDVPRKASFNSGSDILNYIYNAGIRSTYSNMFWCLTDCPTREKLGWTNDSQATAEQVLINFDIVGFYRKWFEDVKADMAESGEMHGTIPTHTWGTDWGPVCDCFLYELPYRIYLYTGESDMLTDAIPCFERYIGFLDRSIKEGREFILGDWLGHGSSKLVPKEFINEFYMIKALRVTAFAYRVSGSPSDRWETAFERRREDFLNTYLDREGRCVINEQTSVSMMLAEGLCRDTGILSAQLREIIKRDKERITYGMVGIQYIYKALSLSGLSDSAYRMISESDPGYRTWYESGATTLWECWDGKYEGSHNHHMYSNVLSWFFICLLGISPKEDAPAFEKIELEPCFVKEIGFAEGHMDTVRGRIEASWRYLGDGFEYTVILPEGISASFGGTPLSVGKNVFEVKQ